jgi:Kef-type K+ transport system membrane component KefB
MRRIFVYLLMLALCGACLWLTLRSGRTLQSSANRHIIEASSQTDITKVFRDNFRSPLGILLTQFIVVLIAAKGVGALAVKVGQPHVIGEVIAGILLGPSFLGLLNPAAVDYLFPGSSVDVLRLFSQIGVILYMFIVGMDIDTHYLFKNVHTVVLVSHASIVLPFLLGTTLSLLIYPLMAPPTIAFSAFALFMGVAMSITAFPVLARIVEERGLSRSPLGIMSLGCAAVDDVTAWCILAAVLAAVQSNGFGSFLLTVLLIIMYSSVMILFLKPFLKKLFQTRLRSADPSTPALHQYNAYGPTIVLLALMGSLATEVIGVHALFGAFLAGSVIPSGAERSLLKQRLSGVASDLLMPLFFAFTGLRTQMNLLNNRSAWLICALVIAAAVFGKLGGTALAARWIGMSWSDSLTLGALMNTRGLVELIVLNIGYDLGILSQEMFAVLVLMALITTLMTSPLLSLLAAANHPRSPRRQS